MFPPTELPIPSTVKVASSGLPEHVTDETGKINDGGMKVKMVMHESLAIFNPSPINPPLMTVVI